MNTHHAARTPSASLRLLLLAWLFIALPPSALAQDPARPAGGAPVDAIRTPPANEKDDAKQEEDSPLRGVERMKLVWTLHARAVATRHHLNDEHAKQLVETYVEVRAKLADDIAHARSQWVEELDEKLRRALETGRPITNDIHDRTGLEQDITNMTLRTRTRLAQRIVEFLDRPVATRVFPPLAAMDRRVDLMIGFIHDYRLGDEKSFTAIEAIDDFFVETTKLRETRIRDEREMTRATMALRERLFERVRPLLDDEQARQFAGVVSVRAPAPARP